MIESYKNDITEIKRWWDAQSRPKQVMIKYIACASVIIVSLILKALVSFWFFIPFVIGIIVIGHDALREHLQSMKAVEDRLKKSRLDLEDAKKRSRQAYEERKQTEHDLSVQRQKLSAQRSGIGQQILNRRARIAKESALRSYEKQKLKGNFKKQVDDLKDEIKFVKANIIKTHRYYG